MEESAAAVIVAFTADVCGSLCVCFSVWIWWTQERVRSDHTHTLFLCQSEWAGLHTPAFIHHTHTDMCVRWPRFLNDSSDMLWIHNTDTSNIFLMTFVMYFFGVCNRFQMDERLQIARVAQPRSRRTAPAAETHQWWWQEASEGSQRSSFVTLRVCLASFLWAC